MVSKTNGNAADGIIKINAKKGRLGWQTKGQGRAGEDVAQGG